MLSGRSICALLPIAILMGCAAEKAVTGVTSHPPSAQPSQPGIDWSKRLSAVPKRSPDRVMAYRSKTSPSAVVDIDRRDGGSASTNISVSVKGDGSAQRVSGDLESMLLNAAADIVVERMEEETLRYGLQQVSVVCNSTPSDVGQHDRQALAGFCAWYHSGNGQLLVGRTLQHALARDISRLPWNLTEWLTERPMTESESALILAAGAIRASYLATTRNGPVTIGRDLVDYSARLTCTDSGGKCQRAVELLQMAGTLLTTQDVSPETVAHVICDSPDRPERLGPVCAEEKRTDLIRIIAALQAYANAVADIIADGTGTPSELANVVTQFGSVLQAIMKFEGGYPPEAVLAVDDAIDAMKGMVESDAPRVVHGALSLAVDARFFKNHNVNRLLLAGADIVYAKTPDEMKTAIRSGLAPVGGYELKQSDRKWTVAVNAMPGVHVGYEWYRPSTPLKDKGAFAGYIFAPVGIDVTRGFGGKFSLGLFIPILDLGTLVAVRGSTPKPADETRPVQAENQVSDPEGPTFRRFFAPGAYLHTSIIGPFVFGAGASVVPDALVLETSQADRKLQALRFGTFVAVDATLIPF